ncbi:MAG: AbrB/MazE/SpoVT family DNA-binding domain-containing protein [Anaerolineae bacterium]|nr:AbrB/MazE/SpoVT family DNA-binding domain-containing protein [Anaerolineae bacterium]
MVDTLSVQVAKRGTITLPKPLRDRYHIQEGDGLTLLDLGGTFVLTPARSEIDVLADRVCEALQAQGETLESMLHALREERDRVYNESCSSES